MEISLFFMMSQNAFSSSDARTTTLTFCNDGVECFCAKSTIALIMSSATLVGFFPAFPEKIYFLSDK